MLVKLSLLIVSVIIIASPIDLSANRGHFRGGSFFFTNPTYSYYPYNNYHIYRNYRSSSYGYSGQHNVDYQQPNLTITNPDPDPVYFPYGYKKHKTDRYNVN